MASLPACPAGARVHAGACCSGLSSTNPGLYGLTVYVHACVRALQVRVRAVGASGSGHGAWSPTVEVSAKKRLHTKL